MNNKHIKINDDYKRQIEFSALILAKPNHYTELDIVEHFGLSPQTIRRDAERLRSMGIHIHSSKRKFEIINCSDETLHNLILTYLALNKNDSIKNFKLIKKRYENSTLITFVNILNAINDRKMLEIVYNWKKLDTFRKVITPISITRTGRHLYLVAMDNDDKDDIKTYLLEKIDRYEILNKISKVKEYPDVTEIFKTSWGIYRGGKDYNVSLKFNKETGAGIEHRFYIDTQELVEKEDCYILNMKVKLSLEFMAWVMGWGDKVEVIKPQELKGMILERAAGIIKLYKK